MKHIALLNAFPIDFWKPWGRIINSLNVNNKLYNIKKNLNKGINGIDRYFRFDWKLKSRLKEFLSLSIFHFNQPKLSDNCFRKCLWSNKSFQYSCEIDNWKFRYFFTQKIVLPTWFLGNYIKIVIKPSVFNYDNHSTYLYISLYENKQENFNKEKKEKANKIG